MAESYEEYRCRVLGYLGSSDPLRVLRSTPKRLARLLSGARSRRMARRPAEGKWSIQEIVAHLADAELAFGWRVRNVTVTPGVPLQWWDEHLWSERLAYARIPPRVSLASFAAQRAANLEVLRVVTPAAGAAAFGEHPVRGRQTLRDFVVMEAAHDLNHLRQIEALLG